MKPFKFFLETNEVRKTTPNLEEIKSVIYDSKMRFEYFIK